jgi:soluble lytic murein transglycosylase
MTKALRAGAGAAVLGLAAFVQCHGAGGRDVPADTATRDAGAIEEADAAEAQVGPALWVVLDDPRFADARALEDDAHHVEAAAALDADAAKATTSKERCAVHYVVGRLRALGGDDAAAAKAFDDATLEGGAPCALVEYARARGAAAYERLGKTDDAIARASGVDPHVAIAEEAALVNAEALAARGDRAQAAGIWRDHLTKHPRGTRWVDTAARLAGALLDGVEGDAKAHAREAYDLASRIVVEAPTFDESTGASALRKKAIALDASLPRDLSIDDRIKRAQALASAGQGERGRSESEAAIASIAGKDRVSEASCRAHTVRAQAIAKSSKKAATADAWGDALRACAKETDGLATALFAGAKASSAAQRPDEALERYGRVEKELPKHRLADDARLAGALIIHDRDVARFETMLLTLPDDYPDGDMRGEALFRVALDRMARGDWEGAKAPLDRGALIDAPSRHWASAGRSAYFRAKCAAKMGDPSDAKRRLVEVIRSHPLAYYMAQSYGRVAELDAALAQQTLATAVASEPAGPWLTSAHPEMQTSELARAVALLEVGETDFARKEFSASGALGNDSELVWLVASLFDRAGACDVGRSVASKLTDYLEHYPSGKWRFAWEAAYPRAFAPLVLATANDEHVPPPVIWGVMREESAFIADVRSPSNAHGLMQLLPSSAREVARGTSLPSDEAALHRPRVSIALGAKLIGQLRASFADNPSLAIAAYNAGAGAVRTWLRARPTLDFDVWVEEIPYDETRGYIKRVLSSELAYAMLYPPSASAEPLPDAVKEVLLLPAAVSVAGHTSTP